MKQKEQTDIDALYDGIKTTLRNSGVNILAVVNAANAVVEYLTKAGHQSKQVAGGDGKFGVEWEREMFNRDKLSLITSLRHALIENKSCDKSCGPGDYRPGGKCDINGCYEPTKQIAGEWVKGDDPPKKQGFYFIKVKYEIDLNEDILKETCEYIPGYPWPVPEDWTVIEWLDESQPPKQVAQKGNDAVGFAEWCADNGYHYTGYGEWFHDVIREKVSSRYTTEQLYQLFKEKK